MQPKSTGPFLTAAFFCQGVATDDDGVISIHRMVDSLQFTIPADAPPGLPKLATPFIVQPYFYLCFKTDSQEDRYHVKIVCEHPDRTESVIFNATLETRPMDNGCSLALEVVMEFDRPGKRWYRVELDGMVATRVPLLVFFEREETG
jgi:hypothetical protein